MRTRAVRDPYVGFARYAETRALGAVGFHPHNPGKFSGLRANRETKADRIRLLPRRDGAQCSPSKEDSRLGSYGKSSQFRVSPLCGDTDGSDPLFQRVRLFRYSSGTSSNAAAGKAVGE